ncbi:hypothetical protein CEE45_01065 [Candidatus Heimdallarchaeota archaeon B3_Heim]|nr:MAG: hypothetical protein CEE45_01065 [Candidatus Heimdallarchaeota archaeon B3_Heim]
MILELLIEEISGGLVGWYLYQFDLSTPFKAIGYILLNFIIVKGILTLFPFLNPLVDFLTWPFKCNNLFSHIHVTRELDEEIKQGAKLNPAAASQANEEERRVEYGVYNRFELDKRAVGSNFYFSGTTVEDTSKIAMASSKQALYFFLIYLAILPFVELLGILGFIIHMYSSLVLFHALLPSANEQMMIFYEMMRGGHIPPLCMYWFYVVFVVVFLESTLRSGGNALLGLFSAILWTYSYFFFLMFIVRWFNKHPKQYYPVLLKIPDSSAKHNDSIKDRGVKSSLSSEMNYE